MRFVPIGSVKMGSVIARNVFDEQGRILLHSGIPLTETLITKLKLNQINGVQIYDHYSKTEIKDIISPELRQKATKEIRIVFNSVKMEVEKSIKGIGHEAGDMQKKLKLMVDKKYLDKLDGVIGAMLDEITHNRDAMVGLVDIKNMQSFVYQHSIQVTVLSLLVGVALQMNGDMLRELAIGAMLHDVGLTFLDRNLLLYSPSFSDEEKEAYKMHSKLGHDFIKQNTMLSVPTRMGILQHHEENSGNGYPLGLKEHEIHLYARIISLVNVYDKMTSGAVGVVVPPNEVIEYIMGNSGAGRMFDFEIANTFVKRVIPFPIGCYVQLSTGEKAVVHNYNPSFPMRPIVKIIEEGKDPNDLSMINLINHENLNITIKRVVY